MPDSDGYLTVGQRIGIVETRVLNNENRIDSLESWRDEFRGALMLVKVTLGTSILSGVVAIVTLALFATGHVPQ